MYRCEAVSVSAFVQQVAVNYLTKGYWFYVMGEIPPGKDWIAVDRKILQSYGVGISKWSRLRKRARGETTLHYLRFRATWILLATSDGNDCVLKGRGDLKDARVTPIYFQGYSLSYRPGTDGKHHASVRIALNTYLRLKSFLVGNATRRSEAWFLDAFWKIPFEPYAPVRRQLFNILRAVNRRRRVAGMDVVPRNAVRMHRWQTRVFAETEASFSPLSGRPLVAEPGPSGLALEARN